MKDRIDVQIDKIPYRVSIALGGTIFELEFHKNSVAKRVCVSLYRGENCLCAGEPLVLQRILFENSSLGCLYPPVRLLVQDESGLEKLASTENIGNTVFLCVDDE